LIKIHLAALPVGCTILSVNPHGKGSWSAGYKVDVGVHGEEKEYFLKVKVLIASKHRVTDGSLADS
jgi:hypothetical protein